MMRHDNEHTLLNMGLPYDDQRISGLIEDVERDLRNMCLVMQVADHYGFDNIDPDAVRSIFGTFYQYVDARVDDLAKLRDPLETEFSWISLNRLRKSKDFERQPLPREAFSTEEAYADYLASKAPEKRRA